MSKMAERVAEGLYGVYSTGESDWRVFAHAAIRAMREPSSETRAAWLRYYSDPNDDAGFSAQADDIWRAMIDGILSEM